MFYFFVIAVTGNLLMVTINIVMYSIKGWREFGFMAILNFLILLSFLYRK